MDLADPVVARAFGQVGRVFRGAWRLDSVLGVGGMAAVFAATHASGGRAAIKVLHPEMTLDGDATARFLREGAVANDVAHPGAVAILEHGTTEEGAPYLVMELLIGETLAARADARGGRLDLAEVLRIGDAVLDVLVSAHQKGIVHRDLKPDNVFLTESGAVKVLDFGIARVREGSAVAAHRTRTGSTLGTPAFMPPEQALGTKDAVDARSDLWALGATMFSLLTGRLVHEADTLNKLLLAAMTTPAPAVGPLVPQLPAAIAKVIDTALAFDPARRFPDARTMQGRLRAAAAGGVPALGPPPGATGTHPRVASAQSGPLAHVTAAAISRDSVIQPPTRSHRGLLAVGLGIGVLVGGTSFWFLLGHFGSARGATDAPPELAASGEPAGLRPSAEPVLVAPAAQPSAEPSAEPSAGAEPVASAGSPDTPVAPSSAAASASAPPSRPPRPRPGPQRPKKPPSGKNPLETW